MTDDKLIGTFNDYESFKALLRDRKEELKLSNAMLDVLAELPEAYAAKMLADKTSKNIGITAFGKLMKALGVKAILVEDDEQMRKLASRMVERNESQVRRSDMLSGGLHGDIEFKLSRRTLRRIAAMGGKARWAKMTEKQRTRAARRAARARWANRPRPAGRAAGKRRSGAPRAQEPETRRRRAAGTAAATGRAPARLPARQV